MKQTKLQDKESFFFEAICPVCKRKYYRRPEWVHYIVKQYRRIPVCSWTCQREYERDHKPLREYPSDDTE